MEALRVLGCIALAVLVAIWTLGIFWIAPFVMVPKAGYGVEFSPMRLVQAIGIWASGYVAAGVAAALLSLPPYVEAIWREVESKPDLPRDGR